MSEQAESPDPPPESAPVALVPEALSPKVKICGITNLEDAELSVGLGAWTLGMIFYDGSPRRCSLEHAQQIVAAMRRRVELCGVFVNAPLEEIVQVSDELGLTMGTAVAGLGVRWASL